MSKAINYRHIVAIGLNVGATEPEGHADYTLDIVNAMWPLERVEIRESSYNGMTERAMQFVLAAGSKAPTDDDIYALCAILRQECIGHTFDDPEAAEWAQWNELGLEADKFTAYRKPAAFVGPVFNAATDEQAVAA